MTIRFAKTTDKEQVLALLDELSAYINQEVPKRENLVFDEALKNDCAKIFVAEDKGKLLGVATFYLVPMIRRNGTRGHIEEFIVTKDARGKGIGTKIMERIKEYCKENNIVCFKLLSGCKLTGAHNFYEKHGGEINQKAYNFELA